jgi:hypothetical protein
MDAAYIASPMLFTLLFLRLLKFLSFRRKTSRCAKSWKSFDNKNKGGEVGEKIVGQFKEGWLKNSSNAIGYYFLPTPEVSFSR